MTMIENSGGEVESSTTGEATLERSSGTEGVQGRIGNFLAIVAGVLSIDLATKLWIQRNFHLYEQVEVIGDYLRLTFIYNPGAAFGIHVGEHSRIVFLVLALVALIALGAMYWTTPLKDRVRLTAISLICGGALGNLIDRIRSPRGVVDFLDVGVGGVRWPVFNVADIAVTTGALLLAISLWNEERAERADGGLNG